MTASMRSEERRAVVHARRQARRSELLDAAIEVIRRGGAAATMEEMAKAGGISKPILYRHFTDRDGLVSAITEHSLGRLGEMLTAKLDGVAEAGPRETTRATIDAFFEFMENDPELYRFIVDHDSRQGSPATHAFIERLADHVAVALEQGLAWTGDDAARAKVWSRAVVGMVQATGDWWVAGAPITRKQAVDALAELAWGGMRGSRGDHPAAPAR